MVGNTRQHFELPQTCRALSQLELHPIQPNEDALGTGLVIPSQSVLPFDEDTQKCPEMTSETSKHVKLYPFASGRDGHASGHDRDVSEPPEHAIDHFPTPGHVGHALQVTKHDGNEPEGPNASRTPFKFPSDTLIPSQDNPDMQDHLIHVQEHTEDRRNSLDTILNLIVTPNIIPTPSQIHDDMPARVEHLPFTSEQATFSPDMQDCVILSSEHAHDGLYQTLDLSALSHNISSLSQVADDVQAHVKHVPYTADRAEDAPEALFNPAKHVAHKIENVDRKPNGSEMTGIITNPHYTLTRPPGILRCTKCDRSDLGMPKRHTEFCEIEITANLDHDINSDAHQDTPSASKRAKIRHDTPFPFQEDPRSDHMELEQEQLTPKNVRHIHEVVNSPPLTSIMGRTTPIGSQSDLGQPMHGLTEPEEDLSPLSLSPFQALRNFVPQNVSEFSPNNIVLTLVPPNSPEPTTTTLPHVSLQCNPVSNNTPPVTQPQSDPSEDCHSVQTPTVQNSTSAPDKTLSEILQKSLEEIPNSEETEDLSDLEIVPPGPSPTKTFSITPSQ